MDTSSHKARTAVAHAPGGACAICTCRAVGRLSALTVGAGAVMSSLRGDGGESSEAPTVCDGERVRPAPVYAAPSAGGESGWVSGVSGATAAV